MKTNDNNTKWVDSVLEVKATVNAGTANVKFVPEKIDKGVIVNIINATGLKVSAIIIALQVRSRFPA